MKQKTNVVVKTGAGKRQHTTWTENSTRSEWLLPKQIYNQTEMQADLRKFPCYHD